MIYEIMTVYPSRFVEGEVEGLVTAFQTSIEALGGKVERSENLGKLKLAYPIKRDRHGHYVLSYVSLSPEVMAKLDQTMRLSDDVLRHMIISCPKGIPTAPYKLIPYQQPLTAEGRRAGEREVSRGRSDKDSAPAQEGVEVKA
jgi:small subunit ribosomal protein S6